MLYIYTEILFYTQVVGYCKLLTYYKLYTELSQIDFPTYETWVYDWNEQRETISYIIYYK